MEDQKTGHIDWLLLLVTAALMLMSAVFISSASAGVVDKPDVFLLKQLQRVAIGLITIIIFSLIDYHRYTKISKLLLFISVGFLILLLFFGDSTKGAVRWLNLGFLRFQPSELVKYALILHFSVLLVKNSETIKTFQSGFLPFLFWTMLICFLIAFQPNFSTMMVFFAIAMIMIFIGGGNLKHIAITIGIGLLAGISFGLSAEYRWKRIMAFFNSDSVGGEVSYQLNQSLLALGNGGIFGVGTGQSRQSHLFLPEAHTDFIFSIIGEEYGFVGLLIVIAAFIFIIFRGLKIAKNSPDNLGFFLSAGIIITFAVYVIINIAVNTGLMPTTGLPLPLISYGGTATIFNSIAIGILLNISRQGNIYPVLKNVDTQIHEDAINRNIENDNIDTLINRSKTEE